ncbi:glycerol-3-phosphate dehydrogenase [Legionella impletisoli]|uniref:Glycerol-3-phosphate dehydrogenase n=1 Tax=Legionella impletisoli TaxID=343510 RepID=A0A917N8L0_9GAMM|nr:glycerol-3-phosphate dehydrogenase [Legionella impletisoli]GGI77901.1 glycerol-3-phosphate dehydrogenase [Legionella impletisoli]
MDNVYDIAVIGGGINGCGVAADAALRGLSVILFEADDLASKTSSSSTKLIHGGLRYLEHYDFGMVKKALQERQRLLTLAPHLVKPLELVIPHRKHMRPIWMLRTGLFIYDHLSSTNKLPKARYVNRKNNKPLFEPLQEDYDKGFSYYDCTTDDARLTITNALQSSHHGARIKTRTKVVNAEVEDKLWCLTLKPQSGSSYRIKAKVVINAAGPWIESINQMLKAPFLHDMSLVKGSHLLVNKLYEGEHAYFLQHSDERLIFVIPYHGFTMIGTTEVPCSLPSQAMDVSSEEIRYLLDIVNLYFKKSVTNDDIVYSWSGVRPLLAASGKNPEELSRDYTFEYATHPAPSITIYGGKITTYRQLASDVVSALHPVFQELSHSKTGNTPLPGALYKSHTLDQYKQKAQELYSWMPVETLQRFLNTYGTLTEYILLGKHQESDLGNEFFKTVYQAEIDYLMKYEWAKTTEDILWRRTKLGLVMDQKSQKALKEYILSNQLITC